MKVMILAGGLGTRLAEETSLRPKPLVEVGGRPILWHIMKIYAHFGISDFIICLGYKGTLIKEYFAHYFLHHSDITFSLAKNQMKFHRSEAEAWNVTLVDTGQDTMTGGRIRRAAEYLDDDREFCMTYADGLIDVDIGRLIRFHQETGKLATVTAVRPPDRFGRLAMENERIVRFTEKPRGVGWANAGYFVLSRSVIDYIHDDQTSWEQGPIDRLCSEGQLCGYPHEGFWMCMDTLQDRRSLEQLWGTGAAPWKVW